MSIPKSFSPPHDREGVARLLLEEATRWSRTRWCNIPASDRDDVVQDVALKALADLDLGRSLDELLAGIAARVRFRGIDTHRRQRRHRCRSLHEPLSDDGGLVLADTIASRGRDPHEALVFQERLGDLVPHFAALDAYLASAPPRVRIVESLARGGTARQDIAAVLLERHGMRVSHDVVRKVISRDLIGRFPALRFLWENRTSGERAAEARAVAAGVPR